MPNPNALPTPPYRSPLADRQTGMVEIAWATWFDNLRLRLEKAASSLKSVSVSTQGAAILDTPIPLASLPAGLFRISYYIRVTRAATVSSSVQVTISWTDRLVACSVSGTALTGNTTATLESQTVMVRVDQATPVSYAVAYASAGATSAQYSLDLVIEQVI